MVFGILHAFMEIIQNIDIDTGGALFRGLNSLSSRLLLYIPDR